MYKRLICFSISTPSFVSRKVPVESSRVQKSKSSLRLRRPCSDVQRVRLSPGGPETKVQREDQGPPGRRKEGTSLIGSSRPPTDRPFAPTISPTSAASGRHEECRKRPSLRALLARPPRRPHPRGSGESQGRTNRERLGVGASPTEPVTGAPARGAKVSLRAGRRRRAPRPKVRGPPTNAGSRAGPRNLRGRNPGAFQGPARAPSYYSAWDLLAIVGLGSTGPGGCDLPTPLPSPSETGTPETRLKAGTHPPTCQGRHWTPD